MKKIIQGGCLIAGVLLISGCTRPVVKYSPNDFVNPNRVVTREVKEPLLPHVAASFGEENDPAVVKAYEAYTHHKTPPVIKKDGWITYPYSANGKPIIECSLSRFCIVELESGETINAVGLGDKQDWPHSIFKMGEGADASLAIIAKPKMNGIATDLMITTNKRTYLVGLVAKAGADTSILRYYYPRETLVERLDNASGLQASGENSNIISARAMTGSTDIALNQMNFDYKLKGAHPPWRPERVFDDGHKTYIEMPARVSQFNLPVLYLQRSHHLEMVNYRYERPYFVIDGLFRRAWLLSGKGHHQERVEMINQSLRG